MSWKFKGRPFQGECFQNILQPSSKTLSAIVKTGTMCYVTQELVDLTPSSSLDAHIFMVSMMHAEFNPYSPFFCHPVHSIVQQSLKTISWIVECSQLSHGILNLSANIIHWNNKAIYQLTHGISQTQQKKTHSITSKSRNFLPHRRVLRWISAAILWRTTRLV